jgi:glyoxylase-like metal-dependent hydrolase (beta-lactamase superfamily II)
MNVDTDQALASLDTIAEVPADLLLPGHGDPWRGRPAEAVQRALEAGRS